MSPDPLQKWASSKLTYSYKIYHQRENLILSFVRGNIISLLYCISKSMCIIKFASRPCIYRIYKSASAGCAPHSAHSDPLSRFVSQESRGKVIFLLSYIAISCSPGTSRRSVLRRNFFFTELLYIYHLHTINFSYIFCPELRRWTMIVDH